MKACKKTEIKKKIFFFSKNFQRREGMRKVDEERYESGEEHFNDGCISLSPQGSRA